MAWMRRRDNSGGAQKDYLNAADTAGRPMALASILFTLLFIAAIALLIFSAGRWAYNQMIDEQVTVTTTQEETPKNENTSTSNTEVTNTNASTEDTSNSSNTSSASNTEGTSTLSGSTTVNTSSTSNANTVSGASTTSSNVPNTGPGSLLGVFVVTVILATGLHYRYQIAKNR